AMRGRFDAAVEAFRISRQHIEHEYGKLHPNTATVLDNLASALSERGDHEEARQLQDRALRIRETNLGLEHPEVATSHLNMSATLVAMGDAALSRQHAQTALEIFRKVYGEDSLELVRPLNNLANAHAALEQPERALELRQQALALARKHLGDEHPRVAQYRHRLGLLLARLGRDEEAETELRAAMDAYTKTLGAEDPSAGEPCADLAELLVTRLGRADEAVGLAERAVRLAALGEVGDAGRGSARFVLAQALWASQAHRDRPRARLMAQLAVRDLEGDDLRAQVEAWLGAHPAEGEP
ncbi:MAG: tetratricopeptide repeat protein, partial [Myxococcales bacterium]|nr:tetratricopeptide repeat protein [Myxococcales bacterium]